MKNVEGGRGKTTVRPQGRFLDYIRKIDAVSVLDQSYNIMDYFKKFNEGNLDEPCIVCKVVVK